MSGVSLHRDVRADDAVLVLDQAVSGPSPQTALEKRVDQRYSQVNRELMLPDATESCPEQGTANEPVDWGTTNLRATLWNRSEIDLPTFPASPCHTLIRMPVPLGC